MYSGDRHDLCAVLLVEVLKVGKVLEVVCIDLTTVNDLVGLDVIGELLNVKGDVLLGKYLSCNSQNLGVRCRRSGNTDCSTL